MQSTTRRLLFGLLFLASSAHAATNPYDITNNMMPGWNPGNSLDALGGETNWGNPVTTKAMIDKVKAAGFKTLRVPVSWDDFTASDSNFTISSARMDRVAQVVQYGLDDGMYVIINIHHNNGWETPTYANESTARNRLTKLWQQIATRFRSHDADRLIFEVMNEPRSGNDWWGTQENFDVVNRLNAAALSTIRATGGNNASRLVMLPTYVAGANTHQTDAFVKPGDTMVALSVHAYEPYSFALEYPGVSTFTDTAKVDSLFSDLNAKYHSRGTPVVMGEWGSTNKGNLAERVRHAEYYVKAAKRYNIPVILWDNGAFGPGGEAFGQLRRNEGTWAFPEIITAIMRGASTGGASSSSSSAAASSRSSTSSSSSSRASSSATSSAASSASSRASSSASSSASSGPVLSGTGDYPNGFSKCADLGGTCNVTKGTGWVAFGRKGRWVSKYVGVGSSIACTVAAFGSDPGGAPNKCSYQQ